MNHKKAVAFLHFQKLMQQPLFCVPLLKKGAGYGIMHPIRGHGGIGRRDGFRIRWATVQVQVLLPAGNDSGFQPEFFSEDLSMMPRDFPYPDLLDSFVSLCRESFGENLAGVYLHGSAVLRLSESVPCQGIETSAVLVEDCLRPVHPIPFVLHFSETHRERYRTDPDAYLAVMRGTDRDLAAHFSVTRAYGAALYGPPPERMIGEVPREAYADAILYDVGNAEEEIGSHPVYLTLNLCRGLAYLREGLILSKRGGGEWALAHVPERFHGWIRSALKAYREGGKSVDGKEGAAFARYMLAEAARAR